MPRNCERDRGGNPPTVEQIRELAEAAGMRISRTALASPHI